MYWRQLKLKLVRDIMNFVLFRSECFRQDKYVKPKLGIPGNLNNGSQRKNKTTIYEFSIKLVSSKSL